MWVTGKKVAVRSRRDRWGPSGPEADLDRDIWSGWTGPGRSDHGAEHVDGEGEEMGRWGHVVMVMDIDRFLFV